MLCKSAALLPVESHPSRAAVLCEATRGRMGGPSAVIRTAPAVQHNAASLSANFSGRGKTWKTAPDCRGDLAGGPGLGSEPMREGNLRKQRKGKHGSSEEICAPDGFWWSCRFGQISRLTEFIRAGRGRGSPDSAPGPAGTIPAGSPGTGLTEKVPCMRLARAGGTCTYPEWAYTCTCTVYIHVCSSIRYICTQQVAGCTP